MGWMLMSDGPALNWIDASSFEIGGYTITSDYVHGGSQRKSSDHDFTIMKTRNFFHHYTALKGENFKKIIELGVYQGGSFVFLDQFLKPTKFVAVELSAVPIPSLNKYVAKNGDRTRLYYGTSQDDVAKLNEIVEKDFGGQLDLVVDDASHFYGPTKTSFTTLFPRLKPGGLYIIEDWSWGFEAPYQEPTNAWYDQPAPANLIIDLMEDMAMRPLIESVHVERELIKIRRTQHAGGEVFASQARRGRTFNPL
jgi:predicted O-methyltransferase YrrM